jgi:hypothetical protein
MKTQSLHIGMKVTHPQYGTGSVTAITEHSADIAFDGGVRSVSPETCGLEPAEARAALSALELPLNTLIRNTVQSVLDSLGLGPEDELVQQMGARWNKGKMVLHPADPTLQTKEVPMEAFFHKIVMMRNNLRVLEQKVNAHELLTDGDKVELQQYISRCYGSMTTFNILFRSKEDQFGGA